jgi:hypothetical protein
MTTYIKLSTLEYPRHPGDIEIDPAGISDYALVEWVDPPEFNPIRETVSIGQPSNDGAGWKTTWVVEQIPDAVQAKIVRDQRNGKLKDSDWTQVADAPVDKAAWAAYRQDLRDVTAQAGFPWTIDWPTIP